MSKAVTVSDGPAIPGVGRPRRGFTLLEVLLAITIANRIRSGLAEGMRPGA